MTLDEIRETTDYCSRCRLSEKRTNIVFGEGNSSAEIMFVGEGPGADEDRLGRPFVGKAGQLLDKMIVAMGLTREQVYIANVVKCRPPMNRTPEEDECEACLPYLRQQYLAIKPKIIVCLGSTASRHLISPGIKITKDRGNWYEKKNVLFMPTYHPSALLRDPEKKKDAWNDLKKVMEAYANLCGDNDD